MKPSITAYSKITSEGAFFNGELVLVNKHDEIGQFFKDCYVHLGLSYPKYYKMDRLSQLCFFCAEFLLADNERFNNYDRDQVSLLIENRHSSMVSDQKHQNTINNREDYFPSPSVFVYTLPNIMLGELCIRHQINGEVSCFLPEKEGEPFMGHYIQALFDSGTCSCCVAGKVDYMEHAYHAELYLIEKSGMLGEHIAKFESIF